MADTGKDVLAVVVKAARLTADTLLEAINNALNQRNPNEKEGKQSLSSLAGQGAKLQNIEVTDKNIKFFEQSARAYGIDYAIKKVPEETPPRYIVFFKGRDTEQVYKAFEDYKKRLTQQHGKKSVIEEIKTIQQEQSRENNNRTRQREHKKERGMQL